MQKQLLKIDEIIWEVCRTCKNGCSYCGSKEGWNTPVYDLQIRTIVDKINEYKNIGSINISGGDPLLVDIEDHLYITRHFSDSNIEAKILINPRSFRLENDKENKYKILGMYSWVGISINEQCELDYFNEHLADWVKKNNRVTIISNFNVANVFMFEKIRELVTKFNLHWQIQYTVFSDPKDSLALYNSEEANKYLFERLQYAINNGTKIVVADNMNGGGCSAGSSSIGILSNGDVVPCLSMRSWVPDIKTIVQGNLMKQSLKDIWENGFKTYRHEEYKCCKDHCNNKCFNPVPPTWEIQMDECTKIFPPFIDKTLKPFDTGIKMYGVATDSVYTYAVYQPTPRTHPTIQALYAVFADYSTYTSTNNNLDTINNNGKDNIIT